MSWPRHGHKMLLQAVPGRVVLCPAKRHFIVKLRGGNDPSVDARSVPLIGGTQSGPARIGVGELTTFPIQWLGRQVAVQNT